MSEAMLNHVITLAVSAMVATAILTIFRRWSERNRWQGEAREAVKDLEQRRSAEAMRMETAVNLLREQHQTLRARDVVPPYVSGPGTAGMYLNNRVLTPGEARQWVEQWNELQAQSASRSSVQFVPYSAGIKASAPQPPTGTCSYCGGQDGYRLNGRSGWECAGCSAPAKGG